MISSALSSDSDDITKLLNVSLDLITASNTPNAIADGKKKSDELSKGLAAKTYPKPKNGAGMDGLKGGGGIADSERAVEVLSFLVSKTKVRREGKDRSCTQSDFLLPCWSACET